MIKKIPNSKFRKFLILKRLLNGEHLSYQHLAQDYFVSRSSIANDIAYIKSLLAEDNVPLKFDNSGTYITEDEIKRQDIIKRIISKLSMKKDSEVKNLFLNKELYQNIYQSISSMKNIQSFKLSDLYLKNIVIMITILIERGKENHHITDINIEKINPNVLTNQMIELIEKTADYVFTDNELNYLAYIMAVNGINHFVENDIPNEIKLEIRKLIVDIEENIGEDFDENKQLRENLESHIYQMILRSQTHTTIINPILDEIKHSYSKTYGVVWYFLNNFGSNNNLQISDDEVGFVTIYFQTAIERKKSIKRILFVCPHGVGTSSLVAAQLKRILPTNSIIETTSVLEVADKDLKNIDLIVSTIPLPKLSVPVVKVSPLLTANDMKRIMDHYIDTTMVDNSRKNQSFESISTHQAIHKYVIRVADSSNQNEIIEQLIDCNNWQSQGQKDDYFESVKKRESLQSTYLGNGFAIPHGNPKLLTSSCISIAVFEKPITWGNNKADIICMLMIADKDKDSIEPFMDLVMKGIKDKKYFINNIVEFE
ncbi:BglG family transcription antiterminator [Lactobacillus gasseri]|jgi:transcriptional antiterminator|uniref:BglG family transcription antiterminator n=1 Tax=Lactobacillus gasseri TaxID=1596 RepID=UPI001F566B30|nr:PRD domain-containing protein [Lactobacillus gasseri]UNL43835.1 PRD domain-containing protein [Lactobacillus gasseri]